MILFKNMFFQVFMVFFSFLFFIIYFFFSKTFEMLKSWNMLEHGQIVYLTPVQDDHPRKIIEWCPCNLRSEKTDRDIRTQDYRRTENLHTRFRSNWKSARRKTDQVKKTVEEDRPSQKKQLEKIDQVKKTVGEDRPSQTNQLKKNTRQCISPSTYTGGRSPPYN